MRWYDLFSHTYDRQLEKLYAPHRARLFEVLAPPPGATCLDLACGTGQNHDLAQAAIGPAGRIVGVDVSAGMLARARERATRSGWQNVDLLEVDARKLDPARLREVGIDGGVDVAWCTLGLTAIPDWEAVFAAVFALVKPGGRFGILDVHATRRTFHTKMVEWVAQADLDRRVWEPLERTADDFRKIDLDADPRTFGGDLFVAVGTRP